MSESSIENGKVTLEIDSNFTSLSQQMGSGLIDRANSFQLNYKRRDLEYLYRQEFLETLYETNNYAANLIDYLPDSMAKIPPTFKNFQDSDIAEKINQVLVNLIPYFAEASKKARLLGGAGILIGTPGSLEEPVNVTNKLPDYFTVFEGGRTGDLQIDKVCKDPTDKNYLKPLVYTLRNNRSVKIDASRIIPFYGIKCLTKSQLRYYKYWGIPLLARSIDEIRNLDIYDQTIANLIPISTRLIVEINNLDQLMQTAKGRTELRHKMKEIAHSWNVNKVLPVQAGTKVTNLDITYSGLDVPEKHVKESLASTTNIPYERLFNVSKSGRSLSGSSSSSQSSDRQSERQWADFTLTQQVKDWQPGIEGILKVVYFPSYGFPDTANFEIEWHSILQLSETELADIQAKESTAAKNYVDSQILKPETIANAIKNNTDFSTALKDENNQSVNVGDLHNSIVSAKTDIGKVTLQPSMMEQVTQALNSLNQTGLNSSTDQWLHNIEQAKQSLKQLMVDYNHNHGQHGRFASANTSGGGKTATAGGSSNENNKDESKKTSLKDKAVQTVTNLAVPAIAGKIVGGAIANIATQHGVSPELAHVVSEVGVKALTSTALFARSGNKSPQELVTHFLNQASAGTAAKLLGPHIGELGTLLSHDSHIKYLVDAVSSNVNIGALGHLTGNSHVQKIGSASAAGITAGQVASRSGITKSIASKLTGQGQTLSSMFKSGMVRQHDINDVSGYVLDDDSLTLTPEQETTLFDLSLVGALLSISDIPLETSNDKVTLPETTTDDNTKAKRLLNWQGYTIGVQYMPFEQRHGNTLMSGYGHIQNTRNTGLYNGKPGDNMALDCYIGTNLNSKTLWMFEQWIDNEFDEIKFIIGCDSMSDAANAVSMLPADFVRNLKMKPLSYLDQYKLK